MAGVTNREFWDFRVKTRAQFTKLAEQIANIDTSGGGGISELTSKMVVDALGYTPYNANNPANYITSAALTPYLKTEDAEETYATKDYVTTKLVDYAPLTSVQGFENRIGGLEGAVPQLNERVETVESKVATLNEYVVTGENNLLDRVNVIEEEYATKTYIDNAIDGIDLSPYLKTEDAKETYATKDFVNNKLVDYAPLTSVQGFENRIGGLEGAVPQLNERVETVESKVATLNEYVVTGENNLLDRVNTIETDYVTSGNLESAINGIDLSAYLLKADLTKSRIQSTLGISDWALASTKPSYAWSEITSRPTALSQFTDDVVAGKYLPRSGGTISGASGDLFAINRTSGNPQIRFESNGSLLGYLGFTSGAGIVRIGTDSYHILHSGNIGNYKAGDSAKLGGYDISRFLLTTKRDYSSMDLNTIGDKQSIFTEIRTGEVTTSNCPISGYGALLSLKDGNSYAKMQIVSASGSADTYIRCVQGSGSTISANWQRIITDNNIGNYNAGSATKLQTPHTLWGRSFDGTDDISGAITLGGDLNNAAGGIYIHNTNEINSFNGNLYLNHRGSGLTGYGSTNDIVMVANGGNVGIGHTSPAERLDVSGNIKASGNINATSITINGVTITASNGTITVNGNVFAKGDITGGV